MTQPPADALKTEVDRLTEDFPTQPFLLYAMGLRLRTMDYQELAADNLVDGPDDKKIDFFHLDFDTGVATIAQSYQAENWERPAPPANKAADLNTAVAWALESDVESIPRPEIQAYIKQLRDGLHAGEISRIDFFYVHNLHASVQVDEELATVEATAQALLAKYPDVAGGPPTASVRQASAHTVDEWRVSQHANITVHDDVELKSTVKPLEIDTPQWRAVVGSIPGPRLVELHASMAKICSALMSAIIWGAG
ncbi:MAG: hypothetical protein IIC94_04390 [Chloroflexi bacterium]|nr:hypothetical protein [Chloroflexota bacterium]